MNKIKEILVKTTDHSKIDKIKCVNTDYGNISVIYLESNIHKDFKDMIENCPCYLDGLAEKFTKN